MLDLSLGFTAHGLVFGSGLDLGSVFVSGLNIYARLSHIVAHDCSQANT